jgi:hypothetical protein
MPQPETDPNGLNPHIAGAKLDKDKAMVWTCLSGFAHALQAVAEVTTHGAQKYTPNGWVSVADGEQRYMEAFGRHLLELGKGDDIDAGSGCLHKAQMVWNLLASLELELRGAREVHDLFTAPTPPSISQPWHGIYP